MQRGNRFGTIPVACSLGAIWNLTVSRGPSRNCRTTRSKRPRKRSLLRSSGLFWQNACVSVSVLLRMPWWLWQMGLLTSGNMRWSILGRSFLLKRCSSLLCTNRCAMRIQIHPRCRSKRSSRFSKVAALEFTTLPCLGAISRRSALHLLMARSVFARSRNLSTRLRCARRLLRILIATLASGSIRCRLMNVPIARVRVRTRALCCMPGVVYLRGRRSAIRARPVVPVLRLAFRCVRRRGFLLTKTSACSLRSWSFWRPAWRRIGLLFLSSVGIAITTQLWGLQLGLSSGTICKLFLRFCLLLMLPFGYASQGRFDRVVAHGVSARKALLAWAPFAGAARLATRKCWNR